jgi:hypothetical protein
MARHFKQGRYIPRNPEKYVGKANDIVYRSSWEHRAMTFLDLNESVLHWNSEEITIPYISPVDNKPHRYFVDLIATFRGKSGETKTLLIEIKPKAQCSPPKEPKRKTEKALTRYFDDLKTYAVNQAKWAAAREFCDRNGIEFVVLTEDHIFGS